MDDGKIVQLYWDRDEQAITESSAKYGPYCHAIAYHILANDRDSEECVNDTWLHAWNAMPPHKPSVLSVFLGKITRNLSFDRYRSLHRDKRGGGSFDAVLEELAECVSGREDPESSWQAKELAGEIQAFLNTLPAEKKYLFILRYWYAEDLKGLAERFQMNTNQISVTLHRIRKNLRAYLLERGYDL